MSIAPGAVAVVTGASSGIGRAIACALAPQVETLVIVGRSAAALEALRDVLSPRTVRCEQVDLGDDVQVGRLVRGVGDALDVLVHAAGTITVGPIERIAVDALDAQYRVNLRAPYLLTRALLPALRARQGQVVFVNSTAGLLAQPGVAHYAATKHGLRGLADGLRAEVNADGVRVISVYPGRTATPMQAAVHAAEGRLFDPERLVQPEDVAALVVQALCLPRTAEVTDITVRPFHKP